MSTHLSVQSISSGYIEVLQNVYIAIYFQGENKGPERLTLETKADKVLWKV